VSVVWYAGLAAVGLGAVAAAVLAVRRRRARELAAMGLGGGTVAVAPPPEARMGATADEPQGAVTADRLGGFEESLSYAEEAGKPIPGVSRAYESLVVAQSPQATRGEPLITPAGATADDLRESGAVKDVARDRGGAGTRLPGEKLPPRR
jgi:hypothetical protein